ALAAAVTAMHVVPMTRAAQAAPTPPGTPVTVMPRNLYLGADINRPVEAALKAQAAGATPQQVVAALAVATHVSRTIVDQTGFPTRSRLLAAEIARTEPDLVGLQEVALWRSGPLELDKGAYPTPPSSTTTSSRSCSTTSPTPAPLTRRSSWVSAPTWSPRASARRWPTRETRA
ncbi:MAG TPA: hypothetical protein VE503_04340, partial [Ornithinibacter sp.]|nr:hypothetical protein [Ornithinibacter sp.]